MYKKFVSCLLTALLILAAAAGWAPAYAGDGDVCEIGETGYPTLGAALAAVSSGETKTITLLENISYNQSISVDSEKNITIDLNGYDLSVTVDTYHALYAVNGSLTISDEGGDGELTVTATGFAAVYTGINGNINITGTVMATGNGNGDRGAWANGGTITITGAVTGHNAGAYANNGLIYITGDVTGTVYGAYAPEYATINITGSAIADTASAAHAEMYSIINITGNVTGGTGSFSNGAVAVFNSAIHVGGDAVGEYSAVAAEAGSTVTVEGNASVTGNSGFVLSSNDSEIVVRGNVVTTGTGPTANNGGEITIDGTVAASENRYAYINGAEKSSVNYEAVSTKPGYRTYYHAGGSGVDPATVWVKMLAVAEIGSTGYETLGAALASISSGETKTITLLQNISHNQSISVDGNKNITIDLNGYDLSVTADIDHALKAASGSLTISDEDGDGTLTVASALDQKAAVYAGAGGVVEITGNATATGGLYSQGVMGAWAAGGTIRITGDVTGYNYGAYADNGVINITGNVTSTIYGVYAPSNSTIDIDGNVTALYWEGVYVQSSSIVNVTGNVSGGVNGCPGVKAYDGSQITIDGTVSGSDGEYVAPNGAWKAIGDYEAVTTKTGYHTYYDAGGDDFGPATVWVKIPSNPGTISFTASSIGTYEGNHTAHTGIGLERTGGSDGAVSVNYAFSSGTAVPGTHYQAASGTVTWADGESGSKYIPYTIYDDSTYNGYVDFYVTLSNPGGGASLSGTNPIRISISDNETPPVPTGLAATAGNGAVTLTWNSVHDAYYSISYSTNPDAITGGSTTDVYDATSKTITGLTNETTYYFAIKSGHNIYFSDFSPAVSGTPASPTGSGGGGGAVVRPPAEPSIYQFAQAGSMTTGMEVVPDKKGNTVTANVTSEIINAILEKAKTKGAVSGQDDIEIKVAGQDAANTEVGIPRNSLRKITDDTDAGVKITAPIASVRFDEKAIETIYDESEGSGTIKISVGIIDTKSLSAKDQEKVAGRPVYDFSVSAGSKQVSDFKGGFATVSIPYTLKAGENPNAIVVYYLSDDGTLKTVRGRYSTETGTVVFKTGHFSSFVIGHNPIQFKDVAKGAWYEKAVAFTAARGIVTGLDEATFGPGQKLTRAQFITMFLRAYGIEPEQNKKLYGKENFSDAGNTWYTEYLLAAKNMGITNGTGNNLFAPNREITRQEMFTMLYNGLKVMGELQGESPAKTTLDFFDDSAQLAKWSKEAAAVLVKEGIVTGNSNKLLPAADTTRGEMAQVLYKLMNK